jgi:hypothetical protein
LAEFDALTGRCCDRSGRFHIDDESDIVVKTLTLWTLYPKGSQSHARSPSKSFDLVFHRLDRLIGLADQDAERTAVGINLNAAHRQPGVDSAPQQARGFSSPVACESARAALGGLWGALRHKACLRGDNAHYGSFFRQGKGNSIEISNTWLTIVNPKFGLPLCINNLKPATFFGLASRRLPSWGPDLRNKNLIIAH